MKNITIVASASSALIKLENLIMQLKAKGFSVNVIATPSALEYFADLKKLVTHDVNKYLKGPTQHINLAKNTDLFVVAPATANTISKFVAGFANNMALSCLLASDQKILFAPAMNDKMLEGIIERNHINWLENNGHYIIGPNYGMLSEGYQAWGRMSEPNEIVETVENILLFPKKTKILVSYGSSKEYIDPIRFMANNSSGKLGKLIIKNLKLFGFDVKGIDASKNNHQEIYNQAKNCDIYVACGALSNFTFNKNDTKIKKNSNFNLTAKPTLNVVEKLSRETNVKIVGFKADDNIKNAIVKKNKLNLDIIIWNKLNTMSNDNITGAIIYNDGQIKLNNTYKTNAAYQIAQLIKEKLI